MNRDETIELFLQGQEAWNAWAEKMLSKRRALEADRRLDEEHPWHDAAAADFSCCLFLARGSERTKEAAGDQDRKDGGEEPPVKSILFDSDRIDFGRLIFPGYTQFDSATFSGTAWFGAAKFWGNALFGRVTFLGTAWFGVATFSRASFDSATFLGTAGFDRATFSVDAGFGGASFQNQTSFFDVKSAHEADFSGIKVDRAFNLTGAKFARVPSFNQADFKQAPDLDDADFPLPCAWPWRKGDKRLIPQYRAIRRIAIQGADYEREQMAFKGEIRCKRGTEHRWYQAAFWYGLAYDAFSDFGRSMSRPLALWLVSIVLFAGAYLALAGKLDSASDVCQAANGTQLESALMVSWRNALPLSVTEAKADRAASECLYGTSLYSGAAIQGVQKIWSAVLIFLFLLALRNQFKIK
jgi:uncharacterized protein YjbI with pentapeptide repeats